MELERVDAPRKSSIGLYIITLLIELFFAYFRAIFFALIFALFGLIGVLLDLDQILSSSLLGNGEIFRGVGRLALIGFILGYANIVASLVVFLGLGSGSLQTRFALGARKLSQREAETITAALERIQQGAGTRVASFSKLYVIDSLLEYAYLVGTTLYVSSAAIRGNNLTVLLAHEFGHIQNSDGSAILALRRFVYPPFSIFIKDVQNYSTNRPPTKYEPRYTGPVDMATQAVNAATQEAIAQEFEPMKMYYLMIAKIINFFMALVGGGIGVWITSWGWASYFRQRDYYADDFVVKIGLKGDLLAYLEQNLFYSTSVPYMLGWQPAHELRIDRIHRLYGSDGDSTDSFTQTIFSSAELNAKTKAWIISKMKELGYPLPSGGTKATKAQLISAFISAQPQFGAKKKPLRERLHDFMNPAPGSDGEGILLLVYAAVALAGIIGIGKLLGWYVPNAMARVAERIAVQEAIEAGAVVSDSIQYGLWAWLLVPFGIGIIVSLVKKDGEAAFGGLMVSAILFAAIFFVLLVDAVIGRVGLWVQRTTNSVEAATNSWFIRLETFFSDQAWPWIRRHPQETAGYIGLAIALLVGWDLVRSEAAKPQKDKPKLVFGVVLCVGAIGTIGWLALQQRQLLPVRAYANTIIETWATENEFTHLILESSVTVEEDIANAVVLFTVDDEGMSFPQVLETTLDFERTLTSWGLSDMTDPIEAFSVQLLTVEERGIDCLPLEQRTANHKLCVLVRYEGELGIALEDENMWWEADYINDNSIFSSTATSIATWTDGTTMYRFPHNWDKVDSDRIDTFSLYVEGRRFGVVIDEQMP